ncbi:MAG TPA: hypothetical protein VGO29_11935 [Solirubrobacteraceae bacterium]|jgi:hypothetical protein|nr:hypothetical protein [Solirubrobacteraceae bacterium]
MGTADAAGVAAFSLAILFAVMTVDISAQAAEPAIRPSNRVSPQLSTQTPRQGISLSVSNGSWVNSPVSYHYAWKGCDRQGAECATISGATTSSYTPSDTDVGTALRAVVTARNFAGEEYATSELSAPVAAASPINNGPPTISPAAPTDGVVESASPGEWTFGSGTYAYQWQDCNSGGEECAPIAGATERSYTPRSADVGAMLEVVVTASNHGLTSTATSGTSGRVVLPVSPRSFYTAHLGTVLSGPSSVWNTTIVERGEVDPNSTSLVETIATWGSQRMNGINTTAFSAPIYTVAANQPTVKVVLDWASPPLNTALQAVPMPPTAVSANGTDKQLVVYQPSSNQLWEFWHLREALPAPTASSFSATVAAGGHLAAGTYYYRVTALSALGETSPSEPFALVTPKPTSSVSLSFKGVIYGQSYKIYRGSSPATTGYIGTLHQSTNVYGTTVTYADTGAVSPTTAPPVTNLAITPGQWHAGWAGNIKTVSSDPGYYRLVRPITGPPTEEPNWGATASSLPIADGVITIGDLEHGEIDHAMQLLVPTARAGAHSYPAQRTDGGEATSSSIPEGAHFSLSSSVECSRQSTRFMRLVCVAAQRYGFIVSDQTGGGLALRAEDPTPLMQAGGVNPYPSYFTDSSGKLWQPHQMMQSFPWSALHLLPMKLEAQNTYHP